MFLPRADGDARPRQKGVRSPFSAVSGRAPTCFGTAVHRDTAMSAGCPLVSVPVLSNSTAPTVRMLSSAQPVLHQHPDLATPPVVMRHHQRDGQTEHECGQAITSLP